MNFEETPLKGAWIITQHPIGDDRGYFSRAFCPNEFKEHGLPSSVAQCNICFSKDAGTIRGMHYQTDPAPETKFIRCTRGAIYDVIIDMRPESATYRQYFGIELTPENLKMLFVPANFAHGFLSLTPDSEAYYMTGQFYTPGCECGVRYNDPAIGIAWPIQPTIVSDKDNQWPLLV